MAEIFVNVDITDFDDGEILSRAIEILADRLGMRGNAKWPSAQGLFGYCHPNCSKKDFVEALGQNFHDLTRVFPLACEAHQAISIGDDGRFDELAREIVSLITGRVV